MFACVAWLAEWLCCAGVFSSDQVFELGSRQTNLDGWVVGIRRSGAAVSYGGVRIASCDHTADNGVVHRLDSFVPAVIRRYVRSPVAGGRWSTADTIRTLIRYLRP